MSDYWTAPCACPMCVLANTESVKYPSGQVLHGRPAAQFLAAKDRRMTAVSELADKLRKELGIKP